MNTEIMSLNIFESVKRASRKLSLLSDEKINEVLTKLADSVEENVELILNENQKDLERMPESDPKFDRLKLTAQRIHDVTADLRNVASLASPLNISLEKKELANGLMLEKITVPLGVIGIIYEARPNVTFDVFALCIKSGNACILKGGSDAAYSNKIIVKLIKEVLETCNVNPGVIELLPADRSSATELLNATGYVDVIIPRGSQNLIDYVRQNSKVPVIETGAGIVHLYFDESGDAGKGADVIFNSKTRRVSVCNALDCLIIHTKRLNDLPALTQKLAEKNVIIYADELSFPAMESTYPAKLLKHAMPEHFGTEFLDYKMSIRTVNNLDEALEHIATHSSRHSEAVVAEDQDVVALFLKSVDAAAVYANASTAFTDGAQFGLGAEIGISTQKLHARGPMALREMTSYKWLIKGNGTIRVP
jgi:glutamate-5-semialdehyde dehydrogenase